MIPPPPRDAGRIFRYDSRPMTLLTRDGIIQALERLDAELSRRGVRAELFLVGGAVMCLVHNARPSTQDVDAWFTEPQVVREAVRAVATDLDLPEDWLNDAAKGFVPQNAGYETWQVLPHLTISTVDARTLLAMKCAAARGEVDAADIRILTRLLGLTTSDEVLRVVLEYFPPERLPVRVRLLLEEMFDEGE